jgi:excisionase family DNA binding protein
MSSPASPRVTPRYLYMRDAAVYLGTTGTALRKRIERRTIPFIKDGRRIKFDTRVLDLYMQERAVAFEPCPDLR